MFTPEKLVELWLKEDIGNGDHTTLSTIPANATGKAKLHVKEPGILAGAEIAKIIFNAFDPGLRIEMLTSDGASISKGDICFVVEGSVRSILQSERLALNVMQRMSGIATETARYVKELEGTGTKVLDTRKTTPGFRYMEKEAVRIGGGENHRIGLYDMIMIKDKHIDFAGGIGRAIDRNNAYLAEKKLDLKIEVEVRSLADITEVLEKGGVHRIMLDNFSLEMTRKAVQMIDGKAETESSGGITFETLRAYAECGVDYISVGALTHHIRSLDMSLKADF